MMLMLGGGLVATKAVSEAFGYKGPPKKPGDGMFMAIALGSVGAGMVFSSRLAPRIGAAALFGVYAKNGADSYSRPGTMAAAIPLLAILPELTDSNFLGNMFFDDQGEGLEGLGDARHQLYSMPRRYWVPDPSKAEKNCYQNKAECLMRFAKYNSRVIDNYSGMEHDESPAEFDAINAKHGLKGDNRVTNISQALWVSLPPGRPYCLDNIDIETLNRTSPALEDPQKIGFLIPDYAIIDRLNREQAELFREQELEEKARAADRDAEPIPF
jgi:hypothetical protein